ncbi:helix-turn-helix domain-containing protein [Agromyces archimandritae]|uniref:Helix-turn-helix domain-containing protein n=1 Tax=Agromyces archimandritae TaxID=2781962 RepID=A0A975IP45_9MICO|nr:helix-turn-helix domain-containing protein [Agromyces archimandritae]QTX05225.1 helix-turn-helix domain-containing protein [Agromyces archimandritae]
MTSTGSADLGRFLSIADTAELLAVDVAVVDELIKSGELPAIQIGSAGHWRIERAHLEAFIELKYEESQARALWNEAQFANVVELSGARGFGGRRS